MIRIFFFFNFLPISSQPFFCHFDRSEYGAEKSTEFDYASQTVAYSLDFSAPFAAPVSRDCKATLKMTKKGK
ncbi:MAG: hypothetical protein CL670_15325 [Balneola sp.]|nr:hypothetical protein [Balneola sp.]